jgi:malonyl-CoA O-methyltransferase
MNAAREGAPPTAPADDPAIVDSRAVRRAFSRAAATYDAAAVLQREVGARMAERLAVVKLAPAAILDAGCGTGDALTELALRYPLARRVAFDLALPMLAMARDRGAERGSTLTRLVDRLRGAAAPPAPPVCVCGDIAALPFAANTFDLVWSNLALQWVNELPRAFAELRRVTRVGGLVTFTTFGPDTLKELRAAFAHVDGHTHVNRFVDMHDIGDLLVHAGFADPVMDMEHVTLTYESAEAMMRDLRAIGATNATQGRPRGLTGRGRWAQAKAALEAMRRDGRLPATYEVVYGHAWKVPPRHTAEGLPIVKMPRRERDSR